MDAKTRALLTNATIIGWLIILCAKQRVKNDEFTSLYIRLLVGLNLLLVLIAAVAIVGWVM